MRTLQSIIQEKLKIKVEKEIILSDKQLNVYNEIVDILNLKDKEVYKNINNDTIDDITLAIKKWLFENNIQQIEVYCTTDDYYLLDDIGLNTIHKSIVKDDDDLALKLAREKYKKVIVCRDGCKPCLRINDIIIEFTVDAGGIYFIDKEAL